MSCFLQVYKYVLNQFSNDRLKATIYDAIIIHRLVVHFPCFSSLCLVTFIHFKSVVDSGNYSAAD